MTRPLLFVLLLCCERACSWSAAPARSAVPARAPAPRMLAKRGKFKGGRLDDFVAAAEAEAKYGPQRYAAPGPVPAGSAFVENDSVEFEFRLTAHHLGFVEFELCDSVDITEECFAKHRLIRDVPECRGAEGAAAPHCRAAWKPATESELKGFTVAGGAAYPNGSSIKEPNFIDQYQLRCGAPPSLHGDHRDAARLSPSFDDLM